MNDTTTSHLVTLLRYDVVADWISPVELAGRLIRLLIQVLRLLQQRLHFCDLFCLKATTDHQKLLLWVPQEGPPGNDEQLSSPKSQSGSKHVYTIGRRKWLWGQPLQGCFCRLID